jgi:hypothetical protein
VEVRERPTTSPAFNLKTPLHDTGTAPTVPENANPTLVKRYVEPPFTVIPRFELRDIEATV